MAHRTRIRTNLAAWATSSVVLNTDYDTLDAAQFTAVDGDAGGIWSPSSKIVIGGANGLDLVAPFRSLGASGFNASMQAQNWPERSSVANASTLNSDTPIAWDQVNGVGGGSILCVMPQNQFPATSEDGALWTGRAGLGGIMTGSAKDIAYGNVGGVPGLLASDSSTGTLIKSTDGGVTWTQIGLTSVPVSSVMVWAASLGLWVAAGNAGLVYTSPTGAVWTARTTPAGWIAGCGGAKRIVWNGSLFVIIPTGNYNNFLTSPDGITWTERTVSSFASWKGLAYGSYDGLWMAISNGGHVAKSPDGVTWAAVSIPVTFPGGNDLAVNQSLWVTPALSGALGGIFWSTDQGATWKPVAVGNHRVATAGYQRVIFADNRFVAVHATGAVLEFALSLRSS